MCATLGLAHEVIILLMFGAVACSLTARPPFVVCPCIPFECQCSCRMRHSRRRGSLLWKTTRAVSGILSIASRLGWPCSSETGSNNVAVWLAVLSLAARQPVREARPSARLQNFRTTVGPGGPGAHCAARPHRAFALPRLGKKKSVSYKYSNGNNRRHSKSLENGELARGTRI